MNSFIEVLNKTDTYIEFGWRPEATTGVASYKIYAGQVRSPLTLLVSDIAPRYSETPGSYKKVTYPVSIDTVRTVLGIPTTFSFANLLLYFAITYVDSYGTESPLADSLVVEVPPVGIYGKTMKEDPTINRHLYSFSDELQRWIKFAGSSNGAVIVDPSDYYKANMITEFTRDSSGNVLSSKSYYADRTTTGSPAKLTTYDYTGGYIVKMTISDTTV